jgi:hypothetical protein
MRTDPRRPENRVPGGIQRGIGLVATRALGFDRAGGVSRCDRKTEQICEKGTTKCPKELVSKHDEIMKTDALQATMTR